MIHLKNENMIELSKENTGQPIHAYVINLQDASQRRENMHEDLEALSIPYTRIEAIHGDDLTLPIDEYNERKFNILTGKTANKRMIGCYLSHIKALCEFLKSDQPFALILEDDAVLPKETTSLLEGILEHKADWDMVRLSSEREGRYLPFASLPHGFELVYNTRVLKNTAAYLVNRHAAQCCVDKMLPMCLPYDIALDREWDFGFRTACVTPFPVKLNANEPSQIPRAKRIRIFRATTFQRRFHRTRTFRKVSS